MTAPARPDLDAIKAHAQRNAGEAAPMMEMTTWEVLALVAWVEALEQAAARLLDEAADYNLDYGPLAEACELMRALLPPPAPR